MVANKDYRGKATCIFGDGGETAGNFCEWNKQMSVKLNTQDGFDKLEICKLCQSQSLLRSVSFIGSMLKKS